MVRPRQQRTLPMSSVRADVSIQNPTAGRDGRPPRVRGDCQSSLPGRLSAAGRLRCRRGDAVVRRKGGAQSVRHGPAWRPRRSSRWTSDRGLRWKGVSWLRSRRVSLAADHASCRLEVKRQGRLQQDNARHAGHEHVVGSGRGKAATGVYADPGARLDACFRVGWARFDGEGPATKGRESA
eukprot:1051795-Pleurochrysis_carterae.AAC.2